MTGLLKLDAEFDGERIVEGHMERMGGREQLLQQMYSAIATKKDDTVDLALRSYGVRTPSVSSLAALVKKATGCPKSRSYTA